MQEYIKFINQLANISGSIIKEHFRGELFTRSKADSSPVTKIDEMVEDALSLAIGAKFPQHKIYGEEFGGEIGDGFCWIIDPIDGTLSLIAGRPIFGTLISLAYNGKAVLGLIDQPITGERWLGGKNLPAMMNDAAIQSSAVKELRDCFFATTSPFLFTPAHQVRIRDLSSQCNRVIYGGDCYNYAMLAMGHIDLVIEQGLKIYDYMAVSTLVESAGGYCCDFAGEKITAHSNGSLIAAATRELAMAALEYMRA